MFFSGPATVDGVTFADRPKVVFVPLREVANDLHLPFGKAKGKFALGGAALAAHGPTLADGTRLVPIAGLAKLGVHVAYDRKTGLTRLGRKGRAMYVRRGAKRVYIDETKQVLRGLQGTRTVIRAPIGSGIEGKNTPNGIFKVQGYRAKMLHSKLYQGAPMPWAVQIVGNIFVHGWPRVKGRPASHGCIHLPMTGANPAKFFYDWSDTGTPVVITGKWRG